MTHSCAVLDGGGVQCWGTNSHGQLGTESNHAAGTGPGNVSVSMSSLGEVPLSAPAIAVATGGMEESGGVAHTCVILEDGRVQCWGSGSYGQLGYGSQITLGRNAGEISSLGSVNLGGASAVAIDAGGGHTCVVVDVGHVSCWGLNDKGQLGYNHTYNVGDGTRWAGTVDLGSVTAVDVACGGRHTCVILNTGGVKCWGENSHGQVPSSPALRATVPPALTRTLIPTLLP